MKSMVIIILFTSSLIHANPLKDLLAVKKQEPDLRYYSLLPECDEKDPDIRFIKSRESESMSLEHDFLEMIEAATAAPCFIETGTFKGDTTHKASQYFSYVHTIELDQKLYEKAKKRFKNNNSIMVHHGDTLTQLPKILKTIKDKAIIFLDAHYSMGETAKGDFNTPILHEFEKIKRSGLKNPILIIDDIRMFYEPINDVKATFIEDYPTLNTIVEAILEVNSSYQCAVVYDTLIAFTLQENITVSPTVRAATISRLYNGTNYIIDDVLKAELAISHAQDSEQSALIELAQRWVEKWSEPAGLSRHYSLWNGLLLLAHEQYAQSNIWLNDAKKRGLNDWRIDWYIAMAQAECFFGYR